MADHPLSTRDLAARSVGSGAANPTMQREPLMREGVATGRDDPAEDGNARASRRDQLGEPATTAGQEPLLPPDQSERFTSRWQEIQTSFVDRPRDAVAEADALVADVMQRLAAGFSNERERLEAQWDQGDDISTEDLRVALTRYRSFFARLLAA